MKKLIYLIFGFSLVVQVAAKEIYYGSSPELVTISKETIFRFHKQVRTISQARRFEIKPVDVNDPDYSVLSIRPRFTKGISKIAFVLSDGSIVTLKLKIVKASRKRDEAFYDLKPKSMLIERSEKNLPVLTVMDFMKSIDRDDNIIGYKRKITSKRVATGKIKGVAAKLIRVYTGKDYKGFIIELRNRYRSKKYRIKVNKLKFKNREIAIITSIDDEILFPKGKGHYKTTLKVVAKQTASIDDIILPITVINE